MFRCYRKANITYEQAMDEYVGHISTHFCAEVVNILKKNRWIQLKKWGQNSVIPPEFQFISSNSLVKIFKKVIGYLNYIDYLVSDLPLFRDHGIGSIYLFRRENYSLSDLVHYLKTLLW
jgi:hypothetical protein